MWEGIETEQNCNILNPPLLWPSVFLSRSPGLFNRGPGGPPSLGADFPYRILTPTHLISNSSNLQTDWTSCALSYIIVQHPPSCGRHKSHSFNLSTVKVIISWYSATGCTCYLHRCISYFDSPAGSEVNIQHKFKLHRELIYNVW